MNLYGKDKNNDRKRKSMHRDKLYIPFLTNYLGTFIVQMKFLNSTVKHPACCLLSTGEAAFFNRVILSKQLCSMF